MPLRTVSQAMKDLKDCGILITIKDNFDKRRNVYRLNPIIAWKGKVRNRIKTMKPITIIWHPIHLTIM